MISVLDLIQSFKTSPLNQIKMKQGLSLSFLQFLLISSCRMSQKLLSLSGLVYKDLITAMAELQKCEKTATRLSNKIKGLLSTSLESKESSLVKEEEENEEDQALLHPSSSSPSNPLLSLPQSQSYS